MDLIHIRDMLQFVVNNPNGVRYSPEAIAAAREFVKMVDRVYAQGLSDATRSRA